MPSTGPPNSTTSMTGGTEPFTVSSTSKTTRVRTSVWVAFQPLATDRTTPTTTASETIAMSSSPIFTMRLAPTDQGTDSMRVPTTNTTQRQRHALISLPVLGSVLAENSEPRRGGNTHSSN